MIFENPSALWLVLTLPTLLFGLSLWGWRAKKEAVELFLLDIRHLKRKQAEKYIIAGILIVLLFVALALPKVAFSASATSEKTGEIALLVDVSGSMAAQKNLYSASRLERVKPILYEIIDSMEDLGQVKISLYGFTSIARSHVPFVGKEDYPYLRESIRKVLDINSTPLRDTSLGQPILDVAANFSQDEKAKIIILFSDGEPYYWSHRGMTNTERKSIELAVLTVAEMGIKVITIGIGEPEGAKIPIYDIDVKFTGQYEQLLGVDYITYLEEEGLKEIASRTGGEYFLEKNRAGLIKLIRDNISSINAGEVTEEVKIYRPIAHWFLLAALPIWVVFTRRHLLD
ncbi:VWA domain-containing protein [Chloroflexota bacterium]